MAKNWNNEEQKRMVLADRKRKDRDNSLRKKEMKLKKLARIFLR